MKPYFINLYLPQIILHCYLLTTIVWTLNRARACSCECPKDSSKWNKLQALCQMGPCPQGHGSSSILQLGPCWQICHQGTALPSHHGSAQSWASPEFHSLLPGWQSSHKGISVSDGCHIVYWEQQKLGTSSATMDLTP